MESTRREEHEAISYTLPFLRDSTLEIVKWIADLVSNVFVTQPVALFGKLLFQ